MSATNDVTGDSLVSKAANANYRNNYDAIFGKKEKDLSVLTEADWIEGDDAVEQDAYDPDDDNEPYCYACNGSGEGMYDGSTCGVCHGYGHIRTKDEDDYI